jgi:hypothetical protein
MDLLILFLDLDAMAKSIVCLPVISSQPGVSATLKPRSIKQCDRGTGKDEG